MSPTEGSEDGVDPDDDAGEEGGAEHEEERKRDHALCRAVFEAVRPAQHLHEAWADRVREEDTEADGDEQDVERGDSSPHFDESYAKRE